MAKRVTAKLAVSIVPLLFLASTMPVATASGAHSGSISGTGLLTSPCGTSTAVAVIGFDQGRFVVAIKSAGGETVDYHRTNGLSGETTVGSVTLPCAELVLTSVDATEDYSCGAVETESFAPNLVIEVFASSEITTTLLSSYTLTFEGNAVSACSFDTGNALSISFTASQIAMVGQPFSATLTIQLNTELAIVSVLPTLPTAESSVCGAVEYSASTDALNGATWIMTPADAPVGVAGLAGPQLVLAWTMKGYKVGECVVKVEVIDQVTGRTSGVLSSLTRVIPEISLTPIELGAMTVIATNNWGDDRAEVVAPPPLREVTVTMAGSRAYVVVKAQVGSEEADRDLADKARFTITPSLSSEEFSAIASGLGFFGTPGSLTWELEFASSTGKLLDWAVLAVVYADQTKDICLNGVFVDGGSFETHQGAKTECVRVTGVKAGNVAPCDEGDLGCAIVDREVAGRLGIAGPSL